jgi:CubicO group peptidase (beta-lactamase class C family)
LQKILKRFIILAQKKLNNVPGAEFIYSNSNYNLLAIIVQRVSGQSLAEFTEQNIFVPAGMTNTEWRDNRNRIVKDRAIAYRLTENGYETLMPNEDAYGNGGLLTTTEDLLKWNDFYLSGSSKNPVISIELFFRNSFLKINI